MHFVLRLFVSGAAPRSRCAIETVRAVCESCLHGDYELEVIDLYQQPELATEEQVVALPTLLRKAPLPERRLVGDMSDRVRVMAALGLHQPEEPPTPSPSTGRGLHEEP